MFLTTFLGHQGWIFQSARSCVLVDPLLREEFGQAHALDYRVYPPRNLKLESFPRVDAVALTHEHDDHFDIPSLAQIDRRIPVLLSTRSSTAAYKILCQMGFQVHPLVPGAPSLIGDLEIMPLFADHVNTYSGDEWDTLPFLISHKGGAGSFFSMVDVELTPTHLELCRMRVPRPGLVGWTNNALDWSHVYTHQAAPGDETARFAQRLDAEHRMISDLWGPPSATLMCAGGFSFHGPRAWLNERVFHTDLRRVCKAMEVLHPTRRVFATRPGEAFRMEENLLKEVDAESTFLATAPPEGWPSRVQSPMKELPDYGPATGHKELGREDLDRLRLRLAEFARALVGSALFKSQYSLLDAAIEGRVPTFAFVLRNGSPGSALVFEYNPNACSFEPGRVADPRGIYLAGMECWASDLLAVLSGDLGHIALSFGRCQIWNALPQFYNFSLVDELQRVSHPLSRPAEFLRIYERLWQQCSAVTPTIMPR